MAMNASVAMNGTKNVSLPQANDSVCEPFIQDATSRTGLIALYVLAIVFSLIGNAILLLVVCRNRQLRTATFILLANIALSDLLLPVFHLPYAVEYLISHVTPAWPISGSAGEAMCKIRMHAVDISQGVSVSSLAAITVVRCTTAMNPNTPRFQSCRSRFLTVISTWLLALTFTLLRKNEESKNTEVGEAAYNETACYEFRAFERVEGLLPSLEFTITIMSIFFVFPILLTCILYCFAAMATKRRRHDNENDVNNRVHNGNGQENVRTTYVCMAVALVFALCWSPAYVTRIILTLGYKSTPIPCWLRGMWLLGVSLGDCLMAAVIPVIVLIFSREARKSIRGICGGGCGMRKMNLEKDHTAIGSSCNDPRFIELNAREMVVQ